MSFVHVNYLIPIVFFIIIFCLILIFLEKKFFKMIRDFWFYKRSSFNWFSTSLYILSITLLVISTLDLRDKEIKVDTRVQSEKTILLIDTSASMLAEDVGTNRLQKAVLIAKHFARKSAGHQIAIVAFAEIQKKIVPFTNDLDLIDARLESLKNLKNQYGSSALSTALQESIRYFQEIDGQESGNILVLTDGEETSDGIDLKIPKDVKVALVGIGSEGGGRIPLDNNQGIRFGYKKDNGEDVITRLNEDFLKGIVQKIPSAKYWIANSYNLPSEEILNFFLSEKKKSEASEKMTIRPVLMEWLVVPAILFLIASFILKRIRSFYFVFLFFLSYPLFADSEVSDSLKKNLSSRIEKLQKGDLNKLEKIKLADDLYKSGSQQEGLILFNENLKSQSMSSDVPSEAYLNYGTSLLEQGRVNDGIKIYENILNNLNDQEKKKKFKETMEKNLLMTFNRLQKEKNEGSNNKQSDKNSGQGNSNDGSSGSSQSGDKKNNRTNDSKDNDSKENQKNKKKEDEKSKDSNSKDDSPKNDPQKNSRNLNLKKQLPEKLKQLMSDDRQLQMKLIENGTKDLNKKIKRESKDW